MKIAVDAMGGDNAPDAIVEGVVNVAKNKPHLNLVLVGKKEFLKFELEKFSYPGNIKLVNASDVIGMNEAPSTALRRKKDSSIAVGSKLVKEANVDSFISAGNTGAVMAAGLLNIGRLPGIKRPSIATVFPSAKAETLLMDAGANVDSKPINLVQFAIMGQIYAKNVLKIDNPQIGLLSIGEEKKKGNQLTSSTYELLEKDKRINNFIGNVEGRDIFNGNCDIVICDGFVGNVVLKTTEGVASLMFKMLKEVMTENFISKAGGFLIKPYLKKFMDKVDYRNYGGAPLLGVNGSVIICHGSSDATAIMNAINVAEQSINTGLVDLIEAEINKE